MKNVTIGLIQMGMAQSPNENLERAVGLIARAARKGADIACLPELFLTPYFPAKAGNLEGLPQSFMENMRGKTMQMLSGAAAENDIALVAGSVFEKSGNKLYNTSAVFEKNGKLAGIYRKMHIPHDDFFYEKDYFEKGDLGFRVFTLGKAKVAVLICFDQWFPEAARICALKGAQLIFYPTAIGAVSGIKQVEGNWHDAWENVMRGHAIANNVVVAAANRVGREGKTRFWGGSFVCNAFGKTLKRAGAREEILISTVDLDHGKNIRDGWQFFMNRRPSEYGLLSK
ncbi:MAG: nitrilase-related carbon-nitrogen hydrolase [Candidatus Micrarchaeota archaeon]